MCKDCSLVNTYFCTDNNGNIYYYNFSNKKYYIFIDLSSGKYFIRKILKEYFMFESENLEIFIMNICFFTLFK